MYIREYFALCSRNIYKAILLVFIIAFLMHSLAGGGTTKNMVLRASNVWTQSPVNEVQGSALPRINPYKCVRTPNLSDQKVNFMMCLKPVETDWSISKAFDDNGVWEEDLVTLMLDLTHTYPKATFLDLGANIGTFSNAIAASKYRVLSVDAVATNLAYIRASTQLSNNEEYIHFILNGVSDEKFQLYPFNERLENEGFVNLLSAEEAASKPQEQIGKPVNSVSLLEIMEYGGSDVYILKADVEGFECKALGGYIHSKNKRAYVPFILMEWYHITRNLNNNCPDIQGFIQGFTTSGYSPFDPTNRQPVSLESQASWMDVLWVHKDAIFTIPPITTAAPALETAAPALETSQ